MKKNIGFTLVELLIVISIIAILSMVLTISFSGAQKNSRDQRRVADLQAIQKAAEQMMMLSGTYPTSINSYRSTSAAWTVNGQIVLAKFPSGPKTGETYVATNIGPTGYCVCAKMDNSNGGNSEGGCSFINFGYYCVRNQQ